MKLILCIVLLGANLAVSAQTNLSLSYDDALQMLQKGNQSLKIADKGIEAARTERDKLCGIPACREPVPTSICPKR